MSVSLYTRPGTDSKLTYFVVADPELIPDDVPNRVIRISASDPKFVIKITILLLGSYFEMTGNTFTCDSQESAISAFSRCVKQASKTSVVSSTPKFVKSASDLLQCTGVTKWTCPTNEMTGFAMIGERLFEYANFGILFAILCKQTDQKIIIGEDIFAADMVTLLESWQFETNSAKHIYRHLADSKSKYDINSQEEIDIMFRIGRIANISGKIHVKCAGAKTSVYESAEQCFNYIEESTPKTINPVIRAAFIRRYS